MKNLLSIIFVLIIFSVTAQQLDPLVTKDSLSQQTWVDSIINTMSIDQKIGQLFMIQAYSNKDAKHKAEVEKMNMGLYSLIKVEFTCWNTLGGHVNGMS